MAKCLLLIWLANAILLLLWVLHFREVYTAVADMLAHHLVYHCILVKVDYAAFDKKRVQLCAVLKLLNVIEVKCNMQICALIASRRVQADV